METRAFDDPDDLTFSEVYDKLPASTKQTLGLVLGTVCFFSKFVALVVALLGCVVVFALCVGWVALFWLQTRLIGAMAASLQIVYNEPEGVKRAGGRERLVGEASLSEERDAESTGSEGPKQPEAEESEAAAVAGFPEVYKDLIHDAVKHSTNAALPESREDVYHSQETEANKPTTSQGNISPNRMAPAPELDQQVMKDLPVTNAPTSLSNEEAVTDQKPDHHVKGGQKSSLGYTAEQLAEAKEFHASVTQDRQKNNPQVVSRSVRSQPQLTVTRAKTSHAIAAERKATSAKHVKGNPIQRSHLQQSAKQPSRKPATILPPLNLYKKGSAPSPPQLSTPLTGFTTQTSQVVRTPTMSSVRQVSHMKNKSSTTAGYQHPDLLELDFNFQPGPSSTPVFSDQEKEDKPAFNPAAASFNPASPARQPSELSKHLRASAASFQPVGNFGSQQAQ